MTPPLSLPTPTKPGPTGRTGAQGPKGDTGATGATGPSGQAAGMLFYPDLTSSSDIATYKRLMTSPSGAAESSIVTPCTGTGDVLVAVFATDAGVPGAVDFPAGVSVRSFYAAVSAGSARLHLRVYKRSQAGVETLVRDDFSPAFSNNAVALVEWSSTASAAGALLATDRIVGKVYAQRVTGPTTINVTTFYEGTTHTSSIQTTISAGAQGPVGPQGPAGPSGASTFVSGAGAPTAGIGVDGAIYLDTTTGKVYGPKAAGAWPGTPIGAIYTTTTQWG